MNYLLKKSTYTVLACSAVLTFGVQANSFTQMLSTIFQSSEQQADDCNYDPDDARLPECKEKLKKNEDCKYDPDSAILPCLDNRSKALLLPAVQAATDS